LTLETKPLPAKSFVFNAGIFVTAERGCAVAYLLAITAPGVRRRGASSLGGWPGQLTLETKPLPAKSFVFNAGIFVTAETARAVFRSERRRS
jgi:hypothetical protein